MSAASPPPPPPAATNFLALPLHHFVSSAESGLTVCVVVPCVPRHLEHLQEVLASVDAQTEPAAHVVVALSETDADECALVLASLRARTTTPLSLSCVAAPVSTVPHTSAAATRLLCRQSLHSPPYCVQAYAARNRNRGATLCASADLISFIDADDLMLPDRLAVRTFLLRTLPLILPLESNPKSTPH